ncbi:hypothetical protein [Flexithrix dorotheae]|uniref:hypothetical protein n=1 Tax=Flexithrix dorotheae TaxID=70993 RepID=UPI00039C0270|nr:hypothetical protein [Flexithrix dorotheae]
MKRIIAIIISSIMLMGCDTQTFNFVVNLVSNYEYDIKQTGDFEESQKVTKAEFDLLLIDLDLPDDAEIKKVSIESIGLAFTPDAQNEATSIISTGVYEDDSNGKFNIFENCEAEIPATSGEVVEVSGCLNQAGVDALTDKFWGFITDTDDEDFTVYFSGTTEPGNAFVSSKISVRIKGNIVLENEVEVPFFMGKQ